MTRHMMNHKRQFVYTQLMLAGCFLLVCAAVYNGTLLSWLLPKGALWRVTVSAVGQVQLAYLIAAFVLIIIARWLLAMPALHEKIERPMTARLLLMCFAVALPIYILEWALNPFVHYEPTTALFERDEARGWKLRADADDTWGGWPVKTNSHGFRGPDLPIEKSSDATRILFLGDSVTFGYRLADEHTFPHLVEQQLAATSNQRIEAINTGVGGYSPWQELIVLREQGLAFDPDLVVVGFVLNDVTEKFSLIRFGGDDEGFQLSRSMATLQDRLARHSNIYYTLRKVAAKLRFGDNVAQGAAKKEKLRVTSLVEQPNDEQVAHAWEITLGNVEKIVTLCREHEVPVLLVVFPMTFQFDQPPNKHIPQRIMRDFADKHGVPMIDLLPPMTQWLQTNHEPPAALFMDDSHLTVEGSKLTARLICDAIEEHGLLSSR